MVWILNGIWISESQPFEIQTKGLNFEKTIWNPDKIVKWSGFWMVGTNTIAVAKARPIGNWTIWNPTLKKSRCVWISNGQISDPHFSKHFLLNQFSRNKVFTARWHILTLPFSQSEKGSFLNGINQILTFSEPPPFPLSLTHLWHLTYVLL